MAIVAPPSIIRRAGRLDGPDSLVVHGSPGDHVSLLPIDTVVEGVRTGGLRYPLADEPSVPGTCSRPVQRAAWCDRAGVDAARPAAGDHTTLQGPHSETSP